jgi:hypothetical protein
MTCRHGGVGVRLVVVGRVMMMMMMMIMMMMMMMMMMVMMMMMMMMVMMMMIPRAWWASEGCSGDCLAADNAHSSVRRTNPSEVLDTAADDLPDGACPRPSP